MVRFDTEIEEESLRYKGSGRGDKVAKRREENEPTRFYHVTDHKYRIGEMITPTGPRSNYAVCLNDKPLPHYTIAKEILIDDWEEKILKEEGATDEKIRSLKEKVWYCYEVEPQGSVFYGLENDELKCHNGAKIIKYIGNARAMLQHFKDDCDRKGRDWREDIHVSRSHGTQNIRYGGTEVRLRTNYTDYQEVMKKG